MARGNKRRKRRDSSDPGDDGSDTFASLREQVEGTSQGQKEAVSLLMENGCDSMKMMIGKLEERALAREKQISDLQTEKLMREQNLQDSLGEKVVLENKCRRLVEEMRSVTTDRDFQFNLAQISLVRLRKFENYREQLTSFLNRMNMEIQGNGETVAFQQPDYEHIVDADIEELNTMNRGEMKQLISDLQKQLAHSEYSKQESIMREKNKLKKMYKAKLRRRIRKVKHEMLNVENREGDQGREGDQERAKGDSGSGSGSGSDDGTEEDQERAENESGENREG